MEMTSHCRHCEEEEGHRKSSSSTAQESRAISGPHRCIEHSIGRGAGIPSKEQRRRPPIYVLSQRLIARNVHRLFSSNRGISHFHETCRVDDLSRGSNLGYELLMTFGFGLL